MTGNSPSPPIRLWFASKLKALRIARGYSTARKFAQALGIDENRYTRYERAEVEPDLSLLAKMCSVLQATPNELLDVASPHHFEPGFSEAMQPAIVSPVSDTPNGAPLRRVLAWQLAGEWSRACGVKFGTTLERVAQITRLFGEIEADPFSFVTRMAADPRFAQVDPDTASRIGGLAEQLIGAITAETLGSTQGS